MNTLQLAKQVRQVLAYTKLGRAHRQIDSVGAVNDDLSWYWLVIEEFLLTARDEPSIPLLVTVCKRRMIKEMQRYNRITYGREYYDALDETDTFGDG